MEKRLSLTLFRTIIVLFSCVLLVFTMLNTVKLAAMNDRAAKTEKAIKELIMQSESIRFMVSTS